MNDKPIPVNTQGRIPVVLAGACAECRSAVRQLLRGTSMEIIAESASSSGALQIGVKLAAHLVIVCTPGCEPKHFAASRSATPAAGLFAPRVQQAGLSLREERVLELLASGCSNKKVAQHLGLSMHTVKNELTVLYSKLGVRTRGEAVASMFPGPRRSVPS